eukprot:gnl/Chilomastix_caulleri/929.p1 GENE.gnl/Chilomastix_caulleri/929~~gnl/Chilomastix_caulleri/929.p1  ORF type:complete len:115 (+),score=20.47 gnl/Chilomastix_caulleri/929:88-432(+)
MGNWFCEYCDITLFIDTPKSRTEHCRGIRHKENVIAWWSRFVPHKGELPAKGTPLCFAKGIEGLKAKSRDMKQEDIKTENIPTTPPFLPSCPFDIETIRHAFQRMKLEGYGGPT